MAESTLTLTYVELRETIARFLQYSRTPADWSTEQAAEINAALDAGYRRFLRAGDGHAWSFLNTTTTLTTVADQSENELPDNFGWMGSQFLTYPPTTAFPAVRITNSTLILGKRQFSERTGRPVEAAIRIKTAVAASGTRWEIMWWPTPDAVYTPNLIYVVAPDAVDSGELPIGGMYHSETVKEACLAAAENLEEDEAGLHEGLFKERLAESIRLDRRYQSPRNLGSLPSMSAREGGHFHPIRFSSYEGTVPTD